MKKTKSKYVWIAICAFSLLAVVAQGDALFNFGSTVTGADLDQSPGHVVGGISGTSWNLVGTTGVASGLVNADGTANSLQVDIARGDNTDTLIDWVGADNASGTTMGGAFGATGVFSNNAASFSYGWQELGARVIGLDAGWYRVFVTARQTKNGASAAGDYTIHGGLDSAGSGVTTYTAFDSQLLSNDSDASWVMDDNFWYFEVELAAGQDVVVAVDGKGAEFQNVINTIGIQAIPEPAAGGLLLTGLICVFLVRRAQRR